MKILIGAGILLIITGATLSDTTGISGTWMVQAGIILLFGALTVFSIERYSTKKNPVIWKVIGIISFALMIFLSAWGYLNVIWNVHPLGFIIALAGCIWVFYHGTKRGFAKIFIAIIVGILVVGSGIYFVTKTISNPSQVIPPEGVLKNSSKESTTTPAVDANSIFLEEEVARKKQRDIDREQCIADAEREYVESIAQFELSDDGPPFKARTFLPNVKENIDRCYFRFPNN